MTTWVPGAAGGLFDITNLPYGVFSTAGGPPRPGARIGSYVLDLAAAERAGLLGAGGLLAAPTLNPLLAAGPVRWSALRARLAELLGEPGYQRAVTALLVPLDQVRMHLPFDVADYVDFYSSEQHARNLGELFRPGQPALMPNWKHLPVGYHGRAGTVVVSGTGITRPYGQRRAPGADAPEFGPSVRLDIEAEVGFVVGVPSPLGARVSAEDFRRHVFGVVLVNDWTARDIQAWEYQPLGPFLGKSFATSISAWVVPLDALDAARVPAPPQQPPVLEYLRQRVRYGYDLDLRVTWNGTEVSRPPFRGVYWTPAQQLAHLTVNGAALRTGDLFASGTVSGDGRDTTGSLLELTWGGRDPVTLADGSVRTFLEDGDTITITATAPGADGSRVGLGEVTGTIRAA